MNENNSPEATFGEPDQARKGGFSKVLNSLSGVLEKATGLKVSEMQEEIAESQVFADSGSSICGYALTHHLSPSEAVTRLTDLGVIEDDEVIRKAAAKAQEVDLPRSRRGLTDLIVLTAQETRDRLPKDRSFVNSAITLRASVMSARSAQSGVKPTNSIARTIENVAGTLHDHDKEYLAGEVYRAAFIITRAETRQAELDARATPVTPRETQHATAEM